MIHSRLAVKADAAGCLTAWAEPDLNVGQEEEEQKLHWAAP